MPANEKSILAAILEELSHASSVNVSSNDSNNVLLERIHCLITSSPQEERDYILVSVLNSQALENLRRTNAALAERIIFSLVILYRENKALFECSGIDFLVKDNDADSNNFVPNLKQFQFNRQQNNLCYVHTNKNEKRTEPLSILDGTNFQQLNQALFSDELRIASNTTNITPINIPDLTHKQLFDIAAYTGFHPSLASRIEHSMQSINYVSKGRLTKQLVSSIGGILGSLFLIPTGPLGLGIAALSLVLLANSLYQLGLNCARAPLTDKTGTIKSALQTIFLATLHHDFRGDAQAAVQLLTTAFISADQRRELKELILHVVNSMPSHDRLKCLKAMTDENQPLCQLMDIRRRPYLDTLFFIEGPEKNRTKGMRFTLEHNIVIAEHDCLRESLNNLEKDKVNAPIIETVNFLSQEKRPHLNTAHLCIRQKIMSPS